MKKRRRFFTLPLPVSSGLLIGGFASLAPCHANPKKAASVILPAAPAPTAAEDMMLVRQRLRESLLVGVDAKTTASADIQLATMRPDGSWADQEYADTNRERWKAEAHLPRLLTIAHAYYYPGSPLAGKPEVKAKLLASLAYWLRVDPRNDNWWYNEIGVPKQVGELLILMGNDAPATLRQQGIALMTRSKMDKMTGQNLVWTAQITIMRGCLTPDPELVETTYARMWQEVRYARAGEEGIQIDASFHQHGALLYSGGYGAGFTGDVTRFVSYARQTRFALSSEKQAILEAYVLDGQQWMVRGGQWDFGVTGRELIRAGKSAAGLLQPVESLAQVPGPRQKEMAAFAARFQGKPNAPALTGNRHYWLSDYMAQQRSGYFASTRMYSTRTLNTDGFINGENKTSHHLADGATYLSLDGQEYVGIYPVWDWHRIPGTTVEQNTLLDPRRVNHRGTTRFVGGVSDGRYGVAAMDLATGSLHVQKTWFYFDDEIVCLGAGITCPTPNPVFTSLNQTLLNGPVRTSLSPDADLPRGDHDLANAAWVWHGNIGYVFPTSITAHVRNAAQTGALSELGPGSSEPISKDVFSVWIDHGAQAKEGFYAYIVLPAADAAQTAAKAKKSPVEITSNTPEVQAVWHQKLSVLAAAFHMPGQAQAGKLTVAVDTPCLLLVQRNGKKLRLSVSNPLNEMATVRVTVNAPLEGDCVTHAGKDTSTVTIVLPGGLEAGRSVIRGLTVGN